MARTHGEHRKETAMNEHKAEDHRIGEGVYHPSARPMKVYVDDQGIMYLCDKDVDPARPLREQACWTCDNVLFTRGG
jgi:hypothetical protein